MGYRACKNVRILYHQIEAGENGIIVDSWIILWLLSENNIKEHHNGITQRRIEAF
jgi:hypothetical protein